MSSMKEYAEGTLVLAREGSTTREEGIEGRLTGSIRDCQMSGCRCNRLYVKWSNGKTTVPCEGGMHWDGEKWEIL